MRHEKGSGVNSGRFVWEIEGVNFRVKKSTPKNRADFSSVAQWADIEVCALWPISRFLECGPERNRPAQTGRRFDQTIEHGLLGSAGGAELESAVQLGSPFPRPRAHSNLIRECRRQAVTSCCRMQRRVFARACSLGHTVPYIPLAGDRSRPKGGQVAREMSQARRFRTPAPTGIETIPFPLDNR